MRRISISLLLLTFFGLTPEYRKHTLDIIHEIVYYGGGGYEWWLVYNMPVWLRNYTHKKVIEYKSSETSSSNSSNNTPSKGKKQTNQQIDLANPDRSKIPQQYQTKSYYTTSASPKK